MMLIPFFTLKPPKENTAAHTPLANHRNPNTDNSKMQDNPQNIAEHDTEQPHGQHGNNGSIL